jgi:hypothetical protein
VKRPLEKIRCRWKGIKVDKEISCEDAKWIHLSLDIAHSGGLL